MRDKVFLVRSARSSWQAAPDVAARDSSLNTCHQHRFGEHGPLVECLLKFTTSRSVVTAGKTAFEGGGGQRHFSKYGPLVLRAVTVTAAMLVLTDGPRGRAVEQTGASRFALATVSDGRGKALVDLGPDDFAIEESGAVREILDVRVADYPVAVVIDNGAAARADFASIRAAIARFIERLGPRPVMLVTTAPFPMVVATLEDERETVLSRLNELDVAADPSPGPSADASANPAAHPETTPHATASATPTTNPSTNPQPTADGQPLRAASVAASTIHATGALFSSVIVVTASAVEVSGPSADELVAPIVDSGAVVHVVARGAEGNAAAADRQLVRSIAQQMHGDFTPIYAAPSYQPALDRLATRLTTELMVEYIVPVGSKAADVKIGVRVPGARVRGLGVAPK